ncbi:MAG: phage terminase large subunit family protein [Ruminococcus sp.]|nr:phage terminase large subunit family protein [Ruminococcus sp.]
MTKSELQAIAAEKLNRAIAPAISGFKPPEKLTVSEWADRKRKLSPESSAEVGSWRTSRTPYLKEPMDSFNDPKVRHIVIVASSQVGKSECINNLIGYIIDQDPGSILFIQPTTIDAKEYSKLRIAPMIRDTKCLKSKVSDPKSRDSANTILQKAYPGGILTMCGSTEAHALASKPIRYIFGDERDRWATSAGNEGDPWELATARQITFYNAKSVEVSTPTIKGASAIETAYADGTKERWKTRCPHCGKYSEITFENIRFDKEETVVGNDKTYKVFNIYYICPECGATSTEDEIKRQPSKWVAENPDAYEQHGTRSFWLSSWVSPWASWKSTILQYLKAIGNSRKMQVVYNTRFGLLWEDRGDLEDEDSVMARREQYPAELPDGVLCLTCGVDTQDDRLEYEVVGFGHFWESWGIAKGIIMGRPDLDETWERLDQVIDHVYKFQNGRGLKISCTFVDEGGHFTQDVRQRCRDRLGKKVFAIKGRGGDGIPYTTAPKKQKIVVKGKAIGQTWVYEIGVDAGKQLIFDNLRVQTPGGKYCHFPLRDDYGPAFFKGLLSERLVYKSGRKNPWVWEKIPGHERNEALDCRNYAQAAAKALSPDFDAIGKKFKASKESETPVVRKQPPAKKQRKKFYDDW